MAFLSSAATQEGDRLEQQLLRRPHSRINSPAREHPPSRNHSKSRANSPDSCELGKRRKGNNPDLDIRRTVTEYSNGQNAASPAKEKLGTLQGVCVPLVCNMLGIILFLRFGFILGQVGLLGALLLFAIAFAIDFLTALSVAAICTNGQVRSGGPYYLISRVLGAEFGGSIGVVFYLSLMLNAAMNILGFVETVEETFGKSAESSLAFLPEGSWWTFLYCSVLLIVCTLLCLIGSSAFNRLTTISAVLMGLAIVSIPISTFLKLPFADDYRKVYFTGLSWNTLRDNLLWQFTDNAKGSALPVGQFENFQTVWGVLFPAVSGMLAGTSLSGDLRKPGKSITKGTFWGLEFTLGIYVIVLLCMASTIKRESFYQDLAIIQDTSIASPLVIVGILASTGFSALLGVIACAKILQALARDSLLPVLDVFRQGTEKEDDPTYAILATYSCAQLVLLADDLNAIASLVTMMTLLTFGVVNLACGVLRMSGSVNFRPSFTLFSEWTALTGVAVCFGAMFFTDPTAACVATVVMIVIFVVIHYTSPPKDNWGDVTQSLIYHQVRKYLLRLDERKSNVKFWRPQILLMTSNPRHEWNTIVFCNSIKKGGLYILGHVLKGNFGERVGELRAQQLAWLRLVDISKVKAFVDMTIAPNERDGARSLMQNAGLGGMRPNLVIIGFPDNAEWRKKKQEMLHRRQSGNKSDFTIRGQETSRRESVEFELPTDETKIESPIRSTSLVGILEDALAMRLAVGLSYNFPTLELPIRGEHSEKPRYVDLWPLLSTQSGWETYCMVLQLGQVLVSTPSWKGHTLRVSVFVESILQVEPERKRVETLLSNLRIKAVLRVLHLESSTSSYDYLCRGRPEVDISVDSRMSGDPWYESLKSLRAKSKHARKASERRDRSKEPPKGDDHWDILLATLGGVDTSNNLRIEQAHPKFSPHKTTWDPEDDLDDMSDDSSDSEASIHSAGEYKRTAKARTMSLNLPDEPRGSIRNSMRDQKQYGTLSPTNLSDSVQSAIANLRRRPSSITDEESLIGTPPLSTPGSPMRKRREPSQASQRPLPPQLEFNAIPMRLQFLIINELIRNHTDDDTTVILTSLPAPPSGASETHEQSARYLDQLDSFFADLKPVLAVSSSEQVMTMTL